MKLFALFGLLFLILTVGLVQLPQQVSAQGQNGPPQRQPPPNGNGNQQSGQGQNN